MVKLEDKIPFFRRIMENEFKFQLDWLNRAQQADLSERREQLEQELTEEAARRRERQTYLIDLDRRNQLGRAEAEQKRAVLAQREEFMALLRHDLAEWLHDWLSSDEFFEQLAKTGFHRAEGPAEMAGAFGRRFPDVSYQVRPIDGFILYNDEEGSRIDLTPGRWLERYDKHLTRAYLEMVGV